MVAFLVGSIHVFRAAGGSDFLDRYKVGSISFEFLAPKQVSKPCRWRESSVQVLRDPGPIISDIRLLAMESAVAEDGVNKN